MTDWQEAYFDLVNKVECECVQQGDLVPIWEQFKRMSLTIQKLQGNQAALEAENERLINAGDGDVGLIHWQGERIETLEAENARFRKALEFYADDQPFGNEARKALGVG